MENTGDRNRKSAFCLSRLSSWDPPDPRIGMERIRSLHHFSWEMTFFLHFASDKLLNNSTAEYLTNRHLAKKSLSSLISEPATFVRAIK